jgi:dUTP pyrophosphatase
MRLEIKCVNDTTHDLYNNHKTFHKGDSGFDLFFPEDITIPPGGQEIIDLQIKIKASKDSIPYHDTGCSYFLIPRSSISKTPLRMSNSIGLMDKEYRGPIKVCLDNIKDYSYTIQKGDRLFQIVSHDLSSITYSIVSILDTTTRGEGGLGSTGK